MKLEHDLAGVFGKIWESGRANRSMEAMEYETPQDVVNGIIEADEDVDVKIQALEAFFDVSNEILYSNSAGMNRMQAAALEDFAPNILPKRAPVNSFTQIASKTNYNFALEAVDSKLAALLTAFIAAVVALIIKFVGWGSKKADNIDDRVEEGSKKLTPEEVNKAKEVLVAYEDYLADTDDGRKVSLHDLQVEVLNEHYGKGAERTKQFDMWVLSDTLKGSSSSKAMKFYHTLNDLVAFLRFQSNQMLYATVDFGKEVKKAEFRHIEINQQIQGHVHSLEVAAAGITHNTITGAISLLKKTKLGYDWGAADKLLAEEVNAKNYSSIMLQFFAWMRLNRDVLFEDVNVSAYDFPKDIFTNIEKYNDAVGKALNSKSFDTSPWEDVKGGAKSPEAIKKIEKLEKDILAATKHFDVRDDNGALLAPASADIMPTVKEALKAYRTIVSLAGVAMAQVDDGSRVLFDWRVSLVPELLHADKMLRDDYEEHKKRLANK